MQFDLASQELVGSGSNCIVTHCTYLLPICSPSMKLASVLGFGLLSALAFQFPPRVAVEGPKADDPIIIPLRRESVPIRRQGKVVSFKTSYSGIISVGSPAPQEFRVVFDTGSGHVVIPSVGCQSEACLAHKSFNISASDSAVAINADGTQVPPNELCDQVTIGFGTGEVTGEFVRDKLCLGPTNSTDEHRHGCIEMHVVMAVEMSTQPFKSFLFDGILGLGLSSLALSDEFSFFQLMNNSGHLPAPQFGVFLTEGENGEQSEIAIGGFNHHKTLDPLAWSPVALSELGYWQVRILAVRVNGEELDVCRDGTCRGVVDTGTSHLGIPTPFDLQFADLLTREAGDLLDCRLVEAPKIEFELESMNITLSASNYMRRLPLREGVNVGSATVAFHDENSTNSSNTSNISAVPVIAATPSEEIDENATNVTRHCRPKLMPVNLPAPVGPKLFILGEPVLHRYYTVYDWAQLRVGFSLANTHQNTADPDALVPSHKGILPDEVEKLLMQQHLNVAEPAGESDWAVFVQVKVSVRLCQ